MDTPETHRPAPTAAVVLRLAGEEAEDARPEASRGQRIAFAVAMLAVATYAMISGFQLGYWVALGPGPGFFPFWIGVLMAGGTLVWSLPSILRRTAVLKPGRSAETADPDTIGRSRLAAWIDRHRIWIVVGSLVVLAAVLDLLGFQTAMFLFMMLHLRVLGTVSWLTSLIIAAAGSFGVFHLFWNVLQVPLPLSMLIPLHAIGL